MEAKAGLKVGLKVGSTVGSTVMVMVRSEVKAAGRLLTGHHARRRLERRGGSSALRIWQPVRRAVWRRVEGEARG